MIDNDLEPMRLAIAASRAAMLAGNMPFGAALVRDGLVHQVSGNNQNTSADCTGHAEVVLVVYDPAQTSYQNLLTLFWESHNPTQGMRQGNDIGTQYRSVIYTFNNQQQQAAQHSRQHYQTLLHAAAQADITTEIAPAPTFYYAEEEHQQYLAKHPDGYCGLGGLGISFK